MLVERYPNALKVRLVMDNFNTHEVASLYETFAPAEARRLAERLETHYTPKHGSWLNIAEIELSALTLNGQSCVVAFLRRRQCDAKSLPGNPTATIAVPRSTGASPPRMHGSNSLASIRNYRRYGIIVTGPSTFPAPCRSSIFSTPWSGCIYPLPGSLSLSTLRAWIQRWLFQSFP